MIAMAFLDVGRSASSRRRHDHDLPLVPFIDFLLCLIAFLLVTAVWTEMSRLTATGNAPGRSSASAETPSIELDLRVSERHFDLKWMRAETVIESTTLPRRSIARQDGSVGYPELATTIRDQWRRFGRHRAPTDSALDRAVLHVSNAEAFNEMAAIMDALHAPEREIHGAQRPALSVNLAID